jgi:hypothetical protein
MFGYSGLYAPTATAGMMAAAADQQEKILAAAAYSPAELNVKQQMINGAAAFAPVEKPKIEMYSKVICSQAAHPTRPAC